MQILKFTDESLKGMIELCADLYEIGYKPMSNLYGTITDLLLSGV